MSFRKPFKIGKKIYESRGCRFKKREPVRGMPVSEQICQIFPPFAFICLNNRCIYQFFFLTNLEIFQYFLVRRYIGNEPGCENIWLVRCP